MNKTPIEWTDFTVNPFRFKNLANGRIGHYCVKISPGCKFCYSGAMQKGPYLSGLDFIAENRAKGEIILDTKPLQDVLRRQKPCKIFWCDMTDMFLDEYPDEWIDLCIVVMLATPQLLHQVLTKRSDRLASYWNVWNGMPMAARAHRVATACGKLLMPEASAGMVFSRIKFAAEAPSWVWFGVSAEDQERANERVQDLRWLASFGWNTFVSYEPALGPVDWHGWDFLKQGIVGGESGKQARPFSIDWATQAVNQWRAMDVPPFVKQLGARPGYARQDGWHDMDLVHIKGGDMTEWPAHLQFVREGPFGTQAKA